MSLSFSKAMIIARREYVTTVRRKAFVFSLLFTPFIIFLSTFFTGKVASDEAKKHQHEAKIVALVDSSGLYASAPLSFDYRSGDDASAGSPSTAPRRTAGVPVVMRRFGSQAEALDSLAKGTVTQVLVVSSDFIRTGRARRYENETRAFTSSSDDLHLRIWLTRNLLSATTDTSRIENVLRLSRTMPLFVPARTGGYALKDDARELVGFFLPFIIGFLLSMAIVAGGQYLLQGVAEEKETRILESMLCNVAPEELMVGKMFGLGAAGLTLVGVWIGFGGSFAASSLAAMHLEIPPSLGVLGLVYFLLGYLFFASLMTGIGAVTSNLREAQQMAVTFTMLNFIPFWILTPIVNTPNSTLAVGMSLFPPTAATTMMMRLCSGSMTGAVIPLWQVATSIALLALTAYLTVRVSSKVFRMGLLLYGKTPTLPEIMKLVRQP